MKPSIPHSKESELTEEAIYGIYGEVAERVRVAKHAGTEPNVADLIADYPEFADAIRNLLPALSAMHQMNDGREYVGSVLLAGRDKDHPQSDLGDFCIIREIGRGGMGVVYEAEQISLGRHVALKVLPFAAVLNDRQLQRFKNEALAAGQLDHPHIVDVYGVGCVRGVHYYAMRYVEGQTLAEMILNRTRTEATWQSSRGSDAGLMRTLSKPRRRVFQKTRLVREPNSRRSDLSAIQFTFARWRTWRYNWPMPRRRRFDT